MIMNKQTNKTQTKSMESQTDMHDTNLNVWETCAIIQRL